MATIQTHDGTTLHIEESYGGERPVILIHGWPLSGRSWENQVGALVEAGYRVITYDRRGFGRSEASEAGYDYNTLAADLDAIITGLELHDVTLVGFSMGGGEIARYVANYGQDRLTSVVFVSAVTPFMLQTDDNPHGPVTRAAANQMRSAFETDREKFLDNFTKTFFSANGEVQVSEEERGKTVELARESNQNAALGCMDAFTTTDFREDLATIGCPTLIVHGDADEIVPLEGSASRSHEAIASSGLTVIPGAPHGVIQSHPSKVNDALLAFLGTTGQEHAAGAAGGA